MGEADRGSAAGRPAARCLITGAGGSVGPELALEALRHGLGVRALFHSVPEEGLLPLEAEVMVGDLLDVERLRPALAGVDLVFHLAARLHVSNPVAAMRPEFERVNVEGTRLLLEESLRAGVSRVVLFSTIAVYGDGEGATWTEETPPRPTTIYAETKRASEILALRASRGDGSPLCTVLRLGAVYGPRLKGNYRRLLLGLAAGRFVPIGRGENRRALIFSADATQASLLAALCREAAGATFNVTDGQPHTLRAIIGSMCAALGRQPPRLQIPEGLALAAATAVDGGARLLRRSGSSTRAMLAKYLEDVVVDARRAREILGFSAGVSLEDGWRRCVQALRETGAVR